MLSVLSNFAAPSQPMAEVQRRLETSVQRLSTGLRINSAADDAAGLAISSRMSSRIRGENVAVRNILDGVSLLQTAESALASSVDIVQRVRELAVQSANASNTAGDRQALSAEADVLIAELGRIAQSTQFNGQSILAGTGVDLEIQAGANSGQTINLVTEDVDPSNYGMQQTPFAVARGAPRVLNQPWGQNNVTAGSVTIQGVQSAVIPITANESAQAIATKINATSGQTGVFARAETAVRFNGFAPGDYVLSVQSANGTPVEVAFNVPSNDRAGMEVVASAFNSVSQETGVIASIREIPSSQVFLVSEVGADIRIGTTIFFNAGGVEIRRTSPRSGGIDFEPGAVLAANGVPQTMTANGSFQFYSEQAFGFSRSGTNVVDAVGQTSILLPMSFLNISSAQRATQAMLLADVALNQLGNLRSTLGAANALFDQAIKGLQESAAFQAAAKGRIEDADYAREISELSRTRILQDSGNAMVSQANLQRRQVLEVLLNSARSPVGFA